MKKIEVIAIGDKWAVVENGEVVCELESRDTAMFAAVCLYEDRRRASKNVEGGKPRWDAKEKNL